MSVVAIIPARGGSKRIPGKNIKPFLGRPIIAYSIAAARDSGIFDRVLVSTDDQGIAGTSVAHGAECPFLRPAALSDEHTGTNAVVRHALQWLAEQGESVSLACCIYATAPFVQAEYLEQGLRILRNSNQAFAFSVTSFAFPIQRAIRLRPDRGIEPMFPEHIGSRSQDLEEAYHDAGQFYWGRPEAFLDDTPLFAPTSLPVVLPRHLVQDIDTLEDWTRAELMYRALYPDRQAV